mmetsp:Transcript_18770/g.20953  ORF Transcript_18770/g.20953 Transcript_18770/m.20953 type:complete len:212 (-) Transcript_18770:534-1169(-)
MGFVIQKKGHVLAEAKGIKYVKHPVWLLGMVTQVLANPFLLVALNLSSQSALSFIPALAIINIVIWSKVILGVKMTRYDLLALAFLIPGISLIIASSRVSKTDLNSWEVGDYLFSAQTLIYLFIMVGFFIAFGIFAYNTLVKYNLIKNQNALEEHQLGDGESQPQSERDLPNENQNLPSPKTMDILDHHFVYIPLIFLPFFAGFTATFSNT